jgi:hypothetical protein
MGQSYRIRTELGINKTINVQLDQDFEFLEILSLKIQQTDVYSRSCSEYGVVVGRVTANNGFGIPNARVSVFIPISSVDESNPLITSIYPYKSPTDKNEDGYRYNLLPYEKSYSAHAATGTLPTRDDVLTGGTALEIYDKYYTYTTKTNESGDYMIMGVPLGSQTLVMDVDLSDIGEFSLTPQDLIRVGLATEGQVAGNRFKTSSDLSSLPQIITLTKTLSVAPLWGDPDICQISVNRVDFDLRGDANVDIQPTAVFMGSLFSSPDGFRVRSNAKPRDDMGNLCELVAGPGQILAIRQTINYDADGNPILEQYQMEQSGNIIDGTGTWLTELPMNLDYLTTNQFGEKVLSNDPAIGIPTKGKYRFKVKWSQPPSVSEQTKRAYYLIPNVKEYGWGGTGVDPNYLSTGSTENQRLSSSYYFGLDWSGYTQGFNQPAQATLKNQLLNSKINCEDTFYQFEFNKVYTVASFIDEYKSGAKGRFIGIKEIDNNDCASTINKFPVNDGFRNFDLLYFIFAILMQIIQLIGLPLIIIYHFVAYLWNNFAVPLLTYFIIQFGVNAYLEFTTAYAAIAGAAGFSFGLLALVVPMILKGLLWTAIALFLALNFREIISYKFGRIKLPMIQYPDCQACECDAETTEPGGGDGTNESPPAAGLVTQLSGPSNYFDNTLTYQSDLNLSASGKYQYGSDMVGAYRNAYYPGNGADGANVPIDDFDDWNSVATNMKVVGIAGYASKSNKPQIFKINISESVSIYPNGDEREFVVGMSLPVGERINVFNTRGKYFTGENRIKVTFAKPQNGGKYHFDNTLTILSTQDLSAGDMVSFINPTRTTDSNYLWSGQTSVGGNLLNGINGIVNLNSRLNVPVNFANTQTSNSTQVYDLPKITGNTCVASFTIKITEPGTITYQTCPGYTVTTVITTTGFTSFSNEYCINVSTIGGTAEYEYSGLTTGVDCQRYIYPSDIEYYQVLTAITITTTVVNGVTTYTNPNFNGSTGIWGALNAPNPIQVWNLIDRDGWGKFRPIENLPTTLLGDFKEQKILILQRGVDPYSPKYTNQYGIGKILGYPNEDDVIVTGNTRLNIPIQALPTSSPISVQNHRVESQIFFPTYSYTPGTPTTVWSGFSTSNVGYYGSLDVQSNTSNIAVPTSNGKGIRAISNGQDSTNRYYSDSIVSPYNSNNYYSSAEDLSGGAVMWGDKESSTFSNFWFLNTVRINDRYNGIPLSLYYSPNLYSSFTGVSTTNSGELRLVDSNKIVMRTDRLPSSDFCDNKNGFGPQNNASLLQQNLGFAVYLVDSGVGYSVTSSQFSTGASIVTPDIEGQVGATNVIRSLNTCQNMVGLDCYSGNSINFGIKAGCQAGDVVENGCYIMVNRPLVDLGQDLGTFAEWAFRFRFFYGICRGVLSQSFVNNWVNGTLYAFPIQVDTYYDKNNQPEAPDYPKQLIHFEYKTNTFYYRSSPWNQNAGKFIGRPTGPQPGSDGQISPTNNRQLLFPTTIVNLGIKDDFYQEIIFDPSAKGYIMKSLNPTSYSDTSDLVNLFVISRITDETFLQQIISLNPNNNLDQLFTRPYRRIDGDLAQTMSINSEYGVIPFSPEFYASAGLPSDPVQILGGYGNPTMAIYFSSTTIDLQNKDFLSPGVIDFRPSNNANAITYPYGIKSQEVPFYQWSINPTPATGIFGTEKNSWKTNTADIFSNNYQGLDRRRLTNDSYFYGPNANISDIYQRGYLFNVSGDTSNPLNYTYVAVPPLNTSYPKQFLVGAPNHFYFGIIKGETALDKFKEKYSIDE